MKAEETQARIAHEFVPLVKNAKDDALLLSVLADMLKKHASQLTPSISDEEIEKEANRRFPLGEDLVSQTVQNAKQIGFTHCAKWMRDKQKTNQTEFD